MKKILKRSLKFSVSIAVITFVLAAIFSIVSNMILDGTGWLLGLFVVLIIVSTGVLFDMMGIAATAASVTPFNAMASEKVYGAKHAIRIVRNADRFATFCNDVIGDISGIISGTASTLVVIQLVIVINGGESSGLQYVIGTILTSIVAALTVGGKALGKTVAITASTDLILFAGKVVAVLEDKLHIKVLPDPKKSKKANGKVSKT
ncbi:hypothetical protein CEY16_04130 [Halalkalibacillus sediminis]|uniref:CNNM transmembrane domain-containing protein n=1 Tax=Halalkalibacillus sediminis TaxID=2018042 RepID=A0A2I0QXW7_9BACI|nr:hypothetical protein [Halalkalibacillus sediminis]PKR78950.1 hypothetical protein CEY16_04130 [Halalkalibacillus sediminis]